MARNLFDLDNARDMHKKELVDTFIVTNAFEKLLSPKNQIIIGSRGSGKTALLKMICHDHLSLLKNKIAEKIINDKAFIGVFISTKTKFSGGLRNKDWQNDKEKEKHFVWHMNLAACMSLLETLKSCLNTYIKDAQERIEKEIGIISKIRKYWFPFDRKDILTINDTSLALEDLAIFRQIENQKIRISNEKRINTVGIEFDIELFDPILSAIKVINRELSFPETTSWFICIDEIEMLDEFHHKILNSYMRSKQSNIFFKYTTLPYCHYTIETNLKVPLDIRHDVHYIYIDQDDTFGYKVSSEECNALKLFYKRISLSKPEYTNIEFDMFFGESNLLSNRQINYSTFKKDKQILNEEDVIERMNSNEILALFLQHMNESYKKQGIELLQKREVGKFGNQLGRKTRAILQLRDYFQKISGKQNIDIYSGAKTVIAIGDCNPRKLIKIFNEMLIIADKNYGEGKNKKLRIPLIRPHEQNLVLATIAEQELSRYKIEKNFDSGLYYFINSIGNYMSNLIHNKNLKLTTEQISSIEINNRNDNIHWEIIKRAVQKGLLYPNMNYNNPDDMPIKDGIFHLAFILSPKFHLLPRKGDSRNIARILGEIQLKLNFDA